MNRLIRSFALTLALTGGATTAASAALHAGDAAPEFALPTTSGGSVSSARLKGKPLYMNFFASWCGPCNEEAPAVGTLYKKYHAKGLTVVGIDYLEDKSSASGFAKKYGWAFPIGIDDGSAGEKVGLFGLPVHVFIDKSGKVSTVRYGEMDAPDIEAAIKKIL